MIDWTIWGPPALASFMASMVEFVEALTIVLAVGVVRGWRSALLGAGAGGVLLAALVLALGQTLTRVSLPALQLVVGVLLLMFGLRWLRKAVLRAAGVLPLHDEAEAFAKETQALRQQGAVVSTAIDKIALIAAFKAVVLEGIEVVFIVIALGAGGHLMPASAGAGIALVLVIALGLVLHRPLASVPENSLKFGVGVMLSAFGAFWVGEGIGLEWPGRDWAILALIVAFLAAALALVHLCKQLRLSAPQVGEKMGAAASHPSSALVGVWAEIFGLFVDDGWLAGGVVLWLLIAWSLPPLNLPHEPLSAAFGAGLLVILGLSVAHRARSL